LVLIFWAYAGFEMGTLPAGEVQNPQKAIPRAIITGMLIVGFFYLLTNFVLYGLVNWTELDQSTVPLVVAGTVLFRSAGALIMTVGALFSVAESDESGMLGSARLAYAMAIDGLFPRVFERLHPRYNTPYAVLIVQGVIAFVLSSVGSLSRLISFAVLNLAFSFLLRTHRSTERRGRQPPRPAPHPPDRHPGLPLLLPKGEHTPSLKPFSSPKRPYSFEGSRRRRGISQTCWI